MSFKGTSREQRRKRQRRLKQIQTGGIPMQPAQEELFVAEAVHAGSVELRPLSPEMKARDRELREKAAREAIEAIHREHPALMPCLRAAVPLWTVKLAKLPFWVVERHAHALADIIGSEADALFRDGKPGQAARVFNAIAAGLAAVSFSPGGVTFLGVHFEADHPEATP